MTITYPVVKSIFDTLPIGYYLGRNINTELSETSGDSFFSPFEDKIVVSYPAIAAAFNNNADHICEGVEPESIIRGLFYHEISHVILTPNSLIKLFPARQEIINIFEDERIETLCRDVYMNVNFKRTLFFLVGEPEAPKSVIEAFFNLVRYRVGNSELVDRVNEIIKDFNEITAISSAGKVKEYGDAIINLFEELVKDMKDEAKNKDGSSSDDEFEADENSSSEGSTRSSSSIEMPKDKMKSSSSAMSSEDNSDSKESSSSSEGNTPENSDSKSTPDNKSDDADASSTSSNTADRAEREKMADKLNKALSSLTKLNNNVFKKRIRWLCDQYFDESLNNKMSSIIFEKLKKNKQNGAAINSYSGRLNVRSVGTRDDYRWWSQQNRNGHIKQFSKVHFNLFVDNSGSFYANDKTMNTFIQTLDRISSQSPEFTFDVITINMDVVEWPHHHMQFSSHGGNRLLPDIANVLRRHQKPAANNYNIVLFDGDAHSDDQYSYGHGVNDPFKCFDSSNTIIVTDPSNKDYLDGAKMSNAAIRYCTNYCEMFTDVICDLLSRAI